MAPVDDHSQAPPAGSDQPGMVDITRVEKPTPSSGKDEVGALPEQAARDDAAVTLDPQGNLLTWGSESEMLHGYTNDEVVGKHFSVLFGDDDIRKRELRRLLERCIADGPVESQRWCFTKDDGRFWARCIFTCLTKDDVHVGFGVAIRDNTTEQTAEKRPVSAVEESSTETGPFLQANAGHKLHPSIDNIQAHQPVCQFNPLSTVKQRLMMGTMPATSTVFAGTAKDTMQEPKPTPISSPAQLHPHHNAGYPLLIPPCLYPPPIPPADDYQEELRKIAPFKRILVCEDNLINQKILSKVLHRFAFTDITLAGDGAQGVEAVRRSAEGFDLVLMDVAMPVIDGYGAVAQIKDMGVRVPIIGMLANPMKHDVDRALTKGMDDTISKPLQVKVVCNVLLKYLSREVEEPVYRGRVVCRSRL